MKSVALVYDAFFHGESDVFQQADMLEWVVLHSDNICDGALAKAANIEMSATGSLSDQPLSDGIPGKQRVLYQDRLSRRWKVAYGWKADKRANLSISRPVDA